MANESELGGLPPAPPQLGSSPSENAPSGSELDNQSPRSEQQQIAPALADAPAPPPRRRVLAEWLGRASALKEVAQRLQAMPPHTISRLRLAESMLRNASRMLETGEPGAPESACLLARHVIQSLIENADHVLSDVPSALKQQVGTRFPDEPLVDRGLDALEIARLRLENVSQVSPSREQARAAIALANTVLANASADLNLKRHLLASRFLRVLSLVLVLLCTMLGVAFGISRLLEAPNLATHATWRASSTYPGFDPSAGICDGNATAIFFHTRQEKQPYIEYDLGSVRAISRVDLQNRADCCQERALPLKVEVSVDGKQFEEVARRTTAFRSVSLKFPTVSARFVRITVESETWLHLEQVAIREK